MSDVMLFGVLRMPPELWNDDSLIDKVARHGRYIEAADRIEQLEKELQEAKESIKTAGEYHKSLEEANQKARDWQNEALQSRATINLLTESTAELSAIKDRIKNGEELIMSNWHDITTAPPSKDYHDGWNSALLCVQKQFAAELATQTSTELAEAKTLLKEII